MWSLLHRRRSGRSLTSTDSLLLLTTPPSPSSPSLPPTIPSTSPCTTAAVIGTFSLERRGRISPLHLSFPARYSRAPAWLVKYHVSVSSVVSRAVEGNTLEREGEEREQFLCLFWLLSYKKILSFSWFLADTVSPLLFLDQVRQSLCVCLQGVKGHVLIRFGGKPRLRRELLAGNCSLGGNFRRQSFWRENG